MPAPQPHPGHQWREEGGHVCPVELLSSQAAPRGQFPPPPPAHLKTESLFFVCSAWKMAVLEAKSTPVRLHPPKQGCTVPAQASGRAWVEVTPTLGLMLSSWWPPKTLRPLSKAPGARRGKRWRSVSDRAVRLGCHRWKMTEQRMTLFSGLV